MAKSHVQKGLLQILLEPGEKPQLRVDEKGNWRVEYQNAKGGVYALVFPDISTLILLQRTLL